VMLGAWPEPFGLVAIESMATGTPVIARRAGALPEIIEHGRSGFLVDDLQEAAVAVERAGELDRRQVRHAAMRRFSVERMLDDYERVYQSLVDTREPVRPDVAGGSSTGGGRPGSRNRDQANRLPEPVARVQWDR
jgi:glycogen synthase